MLRASALASSEHLFLLGTGQVGKAVIAQARDGRRITASTRNPNRIFELADLKIEPFIMPLPSAELVQSLAHGADVLVSFPPDGKTDAILAPACSKARRIIYISTTGVYGKTSGRIDESTPADQVDERMRPRLEAESIWKEQDAIVLRVPGIYGPASGMHKRLKDGSYKMPGDGSNCVSRIHVEDLAMIILTMFERASLEESTYLVGDENPCSLMEVVSWLCNEMNIPMPESVSLDEVNPTLRGNRKIDGSRILKELGIALKYPTYKEGYRHCL